MFKFSLLPKIELIQVNSYDGRYYDIPNTSKSYKSVTRILSETDKSTWLYEWKERVGIEVADQISKKARDRGTFYHQRIEQYLLGDPDHDKFLSPFEKKSLRSVWKALDKHASTIYGIELPLYSDDLSAAGTTDLFCEWKGRPTIVDYKTSSHEKKKETISSYFIQATCYAYMIKELYGIDVQDIVIISIPDFEECQIFEESVKMFEKDMKRIFIEERTNDIISKREKNNSQEKH